MEVVKRMIMERGGASGVEESFAMIMAAGGGRQQAATVGVQCLSIKLWWFIWSCHGSMDIIRWWW